MSETQGFDPTKLVQTRDGRDVTDLEKTPGWDGNPLTEYCGFVSCVQCFWSRSGWEKQGFRYRDLVNVASPPAPDAGAEAVGAFGITPLDHEARAIFRVLWGHQVGGVAVYEHDESMWRDAALEVRKVRASAPGAATDDGWRDIATLPHNSDDLLVWCPYNDDTGYLAHAEICFVQGGCINPRAAGGPIADGIEPTHWRPLPSAPKSIAP